MPFRYWEPLRRWVNGDYRRTELGPGHIAEDVALGQEIVTRLKIVALRPGKIAIAQRLGSNTTVLSLSLLTTTLVGTAVTQIHLVQWLAETVRKRRIHLIV